MNDNSPVNTQGDEVMSVLSEIAAEQAKLAEQTKNEISKITGAVQNMPFSPELVAQSYADGRETLREIFDKQAHLRARLEEFIEMLCSIK